LCPPPQARSKRTGSRPERSSKGSSCFSGQLQAASRGACQPRLPYHCTLGDGGMFKADREIVGRTFSTAPPSFRRRLHAAGVDLEETDHVSVILLLFDLQRAFDRDLIAIIGEGFALGA